MNMPDRLQSLDWPAITHSLDRDGWALIPRLIDPETARSVAALDGDDRLFRSRIDMARHGFGRGHYGYFAYPLPPLVARLRTGLYPRLVDVANRWHERLGDPVRFPPDHDAFVVRCHEAGQARPTPLLLRYGPGDHNCLHQDIYGTQVFPLQVTILLSRPGDQATNEGSRGGDFTGGDFVLTEQRPRRQSRVEVVPLDQGDAVVFAVNSRPVGGAKGDYRAAMRHGVGTVRSGQRHTLGIIFHDAA